MTRMEMNWHAPSTLSDTVLVQCQKASVIVQSRRRRLIQSPLCVPSLSVVQCRYERKPHRLHESHQILPTTSTTTAAPQLSSSVFAICSAPVQSVDRLADVLKIPVTELSCHSIGSVSYTHLTLPTKRIV